MPSSIDIGDEEREAGREGGSSGPVVATAGLELGAWAGVGEVGTASSTAMAVVGELRVEESRLGEWWRGGEPDSATDSWSDVVLRALSLSDRLRSR